MATNKILCGGLHDAEILFDNEPLNDTGIKGFKGVVTEVTLEFEDNYNQPVELYDGPISNIPPQPSPAIHYVNVRLAVSSFLTSDNKDASKVGRISTGKTTKEIDTGSEEGKKIMRDLQLDF